MKRLTDIKYYLLPGKCGSDYPHLALYNKAYMYWKKFWADVLKQLGSQEVLTADDFYRQDTVAILVYREEVIAMHLYCKFYLNQTLTPDHTYFANLPPEFVKGLGDLGAQSIMTMEYLTVDSNWRKSQVGVALSAVMVGLGGKIQQVEKMDAVTGICRNDVKVSETTADWGWRSIVPDFIRHNVNCNLMAGFRWEAKMHPDPKVNELVQYYWTNRSDLRSGIQATKVKQAA